MSMRDEARKIFHQALAEASIDAGFARHVSFERGVLRVCDDLFDFNSYSRVVIISMGKAAHTMVEALVRRVGEAKLEGIVVSSVEPAAQLRGFRYFQGGHPTPNSDSIQAAKAILNLLQAQNAESFVIFLISGGGSSIVELPIDDEISLEDLISTYRVLVHSGAPIGEINTIRKHLSRVKGGRLAQAAYPAQQVSIFVSDVPDHTPDALASGPSMPDITSVEDCYRIAEKHQLLASLPLSTRELFQKKSLEETPKSDDPAFQRSRWWTILSNESVLQQARIIAEQSGWDVYVDNSCDDWDYKAAAEHLLTRLRELRKTSHRVCLLSGGEVTVKVTSGGIGGRNQQFALECATKIQGDHITVLSAGTDGIDGNSPAAGAVVDGTTMQRLKDMKLDARGALIKFNAYPQFSDLRDTIETGPTGNNLRDLRILLAY